MKRVVKYWAIRLLGREWMVLSLKAKFASTWLLFSFMLVAGTANWLTEDDGPWWAVVVSMVNLIITANALIRMQKAGEI